MIIPENIKDKWAGAFVLPFPLAYGLTDHPVNYFGGSINNKAAFFSADAISTVVNVKTLPAESFSSVRSILFTMAYITTP